MIVVDNVFAKVRGGELGYIRDLLKYRPKGYVHNKAYKSKRWDGWSNMVDRYGRFPAGLLPYVLEQHVILHDVEDKRVRPDVHLAFTPAELTVPLAEHQEAAVAAAYEAGRGLVQHPVGAGKTRVLIELTRRCGVPALILTHRKDLLVQLAEEFRDSLNSPNLVGVIGGSQWRPGWITIATFQSISYAMKHYAEAQVMQFLMSRQFVAVDEVHHLQAKTFGNVMQQTKNAFYRFGCSATVFKTEGDVETEFKVTGWTGPVVSHYTPAEGVEFGRLVPASIFMVDYGDPVSDRKWKKPRKTKKDPDNPFGQEIPYGPTIPGDYELGVVDNDKRNTAIVDIVARAPHPVLVLIERIEHGEELLISSIILDEGINMVTRLQRDTLIHTFRFIHGDTNPAVRTKTLNEFRDGKIDVLISSIILDEGINIPNIRTLVLAGGGKAQHKLIQRIGRGQRAHEGKGNLMVFDFHDRGRYTGKHRREREKLYASEEAYEMFHCTTDDILIELERAEGSRRS